MSKEISKTYEVSKEEITYELKAAKAEEKKREQEKVKKKDPGAVRFPGFL